MEQITFEQLPSAFVELFHKVENIEKLLELRQDAKPEAEELLTIQAAADFLKLTVPTLYGLVSRSQLPVSKRGKRLYFSKSELTAWIKEGRKKTLMEIQAEADTYLQIKKKGGKL